MKVTWSILLVLAALIGVGGHLALRGRPEHAQPRQNRPPAYSPDWLAADGVVEGTRPEVALRPEVAGTIAAIYFRENEHVTDGDLLVELSNNTQREQVALAQADVAIANADLERLINGERREKREAMAAVESAKNATYLEAQADFERVEHLMRQKAASQEQRDRCYFQMLKAKAELVQATAERALVEAPAREDEVRAAEGRVAAAEARTRLAEAELAKTRITARSPGTVLRVYAEPGEMAGPNSPKSILLLADLSRRRVRAFVEELDAPRVQVGQDAVVTVDGLPGREFSGTVAVALPRMGKRTLQTDEPEEYKDLYFREVMIDLSDADDLMANLRVKTKIRVDRTR